MFFCCSEPVVYECILGCMAKKILSPTEFRLLALVTTERSGREAAKLYRKETGKRISYGTLYTTFRRLREQGWVRVRDDRDEDGRVRFFLVTATGSRALDLSRQHYQELAAFPSRLREAVS